MVFQKYALFPHLTVFENIAFPLRMRRMKGTEITREVMRVLEIVELAHLAHRQPRSLSGGQQQRIALARSIVYQPSIILMDEPLGALDKRLRDQLQIEIKHLHKTLGTTILYVTHDQQETLTMSDRVCLMTNGRVEQIGTPAELYFNPKTEFGARFLGESNIMDIKVVATDAIRMQFRSASLGEGAFSAPTASLAVGDEAKVMVRPERMTIQRAGSVTAQGLNVVAGVVTDIIFSGEITKYFVQADSGQRMAVSTLTDWKRQAVGTDERVTVAWDPAHTMVLASPAGSRS